MLLLLEKPKSLKLTFPHMQRGLWVGAGPSVCQQLDIHKHKPLRVNMYAVTTQACGCLHVCPLPVSDNRTYNACALCL